MRSIILIISIFLLTSCANLDTSGTIAAGKDGKVDYCITMIGNDLFCVKAERTSEEKD